VDPSFGGRLLRALPGVFCGGVSVVMPNEDMRSILDVFISVSYGINLNSLVGRARSARSDKEIDAQAALFLPTLIISVFVERERLNPR